MTRAQRSAPDPGRPGDTEASQPDDARRAAGSAADGSTAYASGTGGPAAGGPTTQTLIAGAVRKWIADLTDLGRRNTLLYYRDLRSGTLDLAAADPAALERLLAAKPVRLSRLFRADADRADAVRRARTIHRKVREMTEERGINAGYLAAGMARWTDQGAEAITKPAAPVLLRALRLAPTRARHDDFELVLDDETEVNPVLLHKLNTEFGADLSPEPLHALLPGGPFDPVPAYERLHKLARAAEVPGFAITQRLVLGTFTYAKLPMVRDLQGAMELLASSDVVAAVAGDPQTQARLGADPPPASAATDSAGPAEARKAAHPRPAGDPAEAELDHPRDDISVLDADSSQLAAIRTIERGQSLVVHGPPGTGKSQTIANLIATLVARGRRVLFVAEKRAAIDAVLGRLNGVDLGDLVLDIHDGTGDRRRIARDLGATLERARHTPPPEVDWLHRRLAGRRELLTQHTDSLHRPRPPWGVTAFGTQAALLGVPESARTTVRFRGTPLQRLDAGTADRVRDELREYAHLGGFAQATGPWRGARIETPEQAAAAHETASRLSSTTLPEARRWLERAIAETGVEPPRALPEWTELLGLYEGVRATLDSFSPQVYGPRLGHLVAATGSGAARRTRGVRLSRRVRGELVREALSLVRAPARTGRVGRYGRGRRRLHHHLAEADRQQRRWPGQGPPRVPSRLEEGLRGHAELVAGLATLRPAVPALAPDWLGALESTLGALAADQVTPWRLPRLHALRGRLAELGLEPLLDELARREASPDTAVHAFDHAWYASILDHLRVTDPGYAGLPGGTLDELAEDFRDCDVRHLRANRTRVRRAGAERLRDAQDRFPAQAQLIRKQAALRRRHLPLRRLLEQAGDVLFALKPCWAMSPLMASQVLPARRLFDVVIFDEASQVVPADAIPSIMRAGQVVVAGDSRQLPPTNFFHQFSDDDDDDDDDDHPAGDGPVSFDSGFESILETLEPLLVSRRLEWHYRSRDERLVAFSNARIYEGTLTTFPGVHAGDCLRHVAVEQPPGAAGAEHTVPAEVDRVVELILEHARTRPGESLGVIAMGAPHAGRVDSALRTALAGHPGLESFFADDAAEPFFVKNLERVQGDERDAIILTVGYGKRADGQMRYHWGPLLRAGGERRLNVAITRAKRRLTLVSSFCRADVDPARVSSEGARLLCDYLEFAESGGARLGRGDPGSPDLTAFERDVRDRLAGAGIPVIARYGIGGYRIDFAAAHPAVPGRMLLAAESDGAAYHRSPDVRDRDRLRQEHLERLGWGFHRIWSTNWFLDPGAEVARIRTAYERAVARATDIEDVDAIETAAQPSGTVPPSGTPEGDGAGGAAGTAVAESTTPAGRPTGADRRSVSGALRGWRRKAAAKRSPPVTSDAGSDPAATTPPVRRRLPRPSITPGLPIADYLHDDIVRLVHWIDSDRLLRTEEETLAEVMDELGFKRRGTRIVAAISTAITAARREQAGR